MPRLTPNQIDELVDLREQGWSDGSLSVRYGVSISTVNWHCMMMGVKGQAPTAPSHRGTGPLITYRNGKPVRRFTPEEDAKLLDMAERNPNRKAIGRELGRGQRSIVARLATLARRAELAA